MRGVFITIFLWLAVAVPARAEPVVVFAAASLKTALDDVAAAFGGALSLSYAGTSVLARQIDRGAPAQIFLSASVDWTDWLEARGRLQASPVHALGNRLVVIAPSGTEPLPLTDLPLRLGTGRLAMALVESVPVGQYGKAALQSLSLWDAVRPHVAQSDNARAALALVATGFAPFGIVYATDARAEPRVAVVADIPADAHADIRYPFARVAGKATSQSDAFFEFLTSPQAREIFVRHGFLTP